MSKVSMLAAIGASLVVGLLTAAPAQALTTVTYISETGDDSNDCTTPAKACATFDKAMANTVNYGTVVCHGTPAPLGFIIISKPIMLDCTPGSAPIQGIIINVAGAVRLRHLHVNGVRGQTDGVIINAAASVIMEDCVIENFTRFGIANNHTGGGKLLIRNTTIQENGTGIGIFAGSGDVSIDNSRIDNNGNGIGIANTGRVTLTRSMISGNSSSALVLDPGGIAIVDGSTINSNGTGFTAPNGSTVLLSNNNVFLNTTAFAGATFSFKNNQVQFGGIGTTPTALGSAQQPFGTM